MRIHWDYSDGRYSWWTPIPHDGHTLPDRPTGCISWAWWLLFRLASRLDWAVQQKLRGLDNARYQSREEKGASR